jgi:hypothetical protein
VPTRFLVGDEGRCTAAILSAALAGNGTACVNACVVGSASSVSSQRLTPPPKSRALFSLDRNVADGCFAVTMIPAIGRCSPEPGNSPRPPPNVCSKNATVGSPRALLAIESRRANGAITAPEGVTVARGDKGSCIASVFVDRVSQVTGLSGT